MLPLNITVYWSVLVKFTKWLRNYAFELTYFIGPEKRKVKYVLDQHVNMGFVYIELKAGESQLNLTLSKIHTSAVLSKILSNRVSKKWYAVLCHRSTCCVVFRPSVGSDSLRPMDCSPLGSQKYMSLQLYNSIYHFVFLLPVFYNCVSFIAVSLERE